MEGRTKNYLERIILKIKENYYEREIVYATKGKIDKSIKALLIRS